MNELNGGLPIGNGAPPDVDGLTGEILRADGGMWNDYTQSWETVVPTRVEKAHGLVQRRRRSADFRREYESYIDSVSRGSADAGGLRLGVYDPEADPGDNLRGGGGDGPR